MLKRVKPFGFLVVLLVLSSGMAQADLVAHWSLDDGAGNTVADSSGNGYGGTFEGNPEWVEGLYGQALNFAGLPDRVVVPYSPGLNPEGAFTVIAWSNVGLGSSGWRSPITSRDDGPQRGYIIYAGDNGNWQFWIGTGSGWSNAAGPPVQMGEWTHTAGVYEPGQQTLYINGVQVGQASGTISLNTQQVLTIGAGRTDVPAGDYFFVGMVDDVALFDNALTEQEIQTAMQGLGAAELASSPIPDDGLPDTPRDTSLSWTPGKYAANHNVYLGTVWEDVNNASVDNPLAALISQDQSATTFDPGRLEFSQTYFWRVDEVNGAPDFTVFEGGVWSFTVEPIAYPITAITATASSSFGASGPEKTIDGSGLVDGLHGVSASDMWISGGIPATIEYAFDRAYKLHELWIWNSNQLIEAFVGFGAKDVVIEHSLDGENWTVLDGVGPLAQASGTEGYAHNNTINFGGAVARHVRVTVNSAQGIAPQVSLSEVRFLFIPTFATRPNPDSGATNVAPDSSLSWGRNGREANRHEVYVGADPDNLVLAGGISESSFDTLDLDLQLGQSYAWRVDEVNEAMDPSTWQGTVWGFTTADTIVIDDMESYKDKEFLEIWATWADGFDDPANGSLAGGTAGIPETGIVNGGSQSLPLDFDNSAASVSEVTRTFDAPMDWTRHGVASLSLYFRGSSENSGGQLYVKINNTKIPYDGDAGDLGRSIWQPWNIDLSTAGGNLMNVSSLTIGVEGAGATGVVYIDDILLYPLAPQFTVPAEPDVANLVARYTFEGNANDTSGNGHNGTPVGAVTFVNDPVRGQVVSLPGGDDQYISIEGMGISGNMPRTIACWAKADSTTIPDWTLIFGFTGTAAGGGGSGSHFNIGSLGGPGGVGAHVWGWEETIFSDEAALEWHHYAMTYDGTTIGYYGDGVPMDSDVGKSNVRDLSASSDRVHVGSRVTQTSSFPGSVDDAVIYSVQLTDAEIAWLAGRTAPMHKGF